MRKITYLEFCGKDKKSGLLGECIKIAVNEHKQVHKGLGGGLELLVLKNTGVANFYYKKHKVGAVNRLSLADAFKKIEELKKEEKKEKLVIAQRISRIPLFKDFFPVWLDEKSKSYKKGSNRPANLRALFKHTLFPLHNYRLCELTPSLVYNKISQIGQTEGNCHNAVELLCQCLRNATLKGIIEINPIEGMLVGSESPFKKPKAKGFKSIPPEDIFKKFFEPLRNTPLLNKIFYLFITLTAFRFDECRLMQWSWIDFSKRLIVIPPDAIGANKTQKDLVKPMTTQIISLLSFWKETGVTSDSEYVFKSSVSSRPANAFTFREPMKALTTRELDFHGIRKCLKTWLVSEGNQTEYISELALTHDVRSQLQKTYDKHDYIEEVRVAMQLWDDYIESGLPKEFLELLKK